MKTFPRAIYDGTHHLQRSIFLQTLLFLSSGVILGEHPALAIGVPAGVEITNQATGSFLDISDNNTKDIISNPVKITVAEIAGIRVDPAGNSSTALSGSSAYFDFKISNIGNDATQFFIPGIPSNISGATASTLKIVSYVTPSGSIVNLTTPIDIPNSGAVTGTLTDPTLDGNIVGGSIPADAALIVRIPVTVTAQSGQSVSVTLGNTTDSPSNQNTPYLNNTSNGQNTDLYTVDNSGSNNGDMNGTPLNGDSTTHRQEASNAQTLTASGLNVTGTVWGDSDGSISLNNSEVGTNAGGLTVYAINNNGEIVAKATVNSSNGTYTLTGLFANAAYTLRLSADNTFAVGDTAPAVSLPAGWTSTGENKAGTPETTTLSEIEVNFATTNLANQDFGIEQLPQTNDVSSTSQVNPIGNGQVQVPTLTGTDPEDGPLETGKTFKIITLPTNGTLYYDGSAVSEGQVITTYDPTLLKVDPVDGSVTVSFTYAAIDGAGKTDPTPGTVTMPFNAAPAKLILVKRITAINGNRIANPNDSTKVLNSVVDDTTSPYAAEDSHPNWPANFLKGELNAGLVKPGDTVEYTIYFINAQGSTARNLRICDRITGNQTFKLAAYSGKDMQAQMGNAAPIDLTSINDGSDRAQFFANSSNALSLCNHQPLPNGQTDNGTIVIDITGSGSSIQPDWTELPGATSPGIPTSSHGWIRFTTQIN